MRFLMDTSIFRPKRMVAYTYLDCVLFRNGYKSTTKLTHDSNLISIISSQKYKEYLVEGKYTAL